MVSGKTISVGNILWKVLKQPIAQDLKYEDAAEYAIEYLRLIGASLSFEDRVERIKLNNYKALLPSNLIDIRGIEYATCDCSGGSAMRYASDTYHTDLGNDRNCTSNENTYIAQGNIITTSHKDGWINIAFKAISTDESGYPMIPDNESFKMGLEYFIVHRYLEGLWSMGKVTDKVFQYYEQKRHFYSGQATTSMIFQNPDQMQTMANSINRMIIDTVPSETFYKNFGTKERLAQY